MDYLEALSKLNKKQKKEILNEIAEKRIEKYGSAGKMANLGDRAFSILGGSGNQIKLNSTEEELFIELAQKTLNKKRNKKNKGGSMLQDDETRKGYATGTEGPIDFRTAQQKHFKEVYNLTDKEDCINGVNVPQIKELIEQVDFDSIIGDRPSGFHGDFILDNILINDNEFTLIDWRQDFSGSIDAGDMHYDLAKLNHNLTLDHETLSKNLFEIKVGEQVKCDVYIKKSKLECQEYLKNFCYNRGISYDAINTLSSIIWINMAPLHEHPLDTFLYYFGKYNLFLNLK